MTTVIKIPWTPWAIVRADAAPEPAARYPEQVEIDIIDAHDRGFGRLSIITVVVSFIHMFWTLRLYSGGAFGEQVSAVALTGSLDYAVYRLSAYMLYAKQRELERSGWVYTFFFVTLGMVLSLNGAYMWANRPPIERVAIWVSMFISAMFSMFVSMSVGVSAVVRAELDGDRKEQLRRLAIKLKAAASRSAGARSAPSQSHNEPLPATEPTALPPAPRVWTLADLLDAMGADAAQVRALLSKLGITTASAAYARLESYGRVPEGLDELTFARLFQELMSVPALDANTGETINLDGDADTGTNTDADASPRDTNGKSAIQARKSDIPLMARRLAAKGVTSFVHATDLMPPMEWSSRTTAARALKLLIDAGIVSQEGKLYRVNAAAVAAYDAPAHP